MKQDLLRWVAVRTKPHQEEQAEACIGRLGVESFLPRLEERKLVRRVYRVCVAPLFPGYLFARIDPFEQYRAVKYAKGVRSIVEFGSSPAFVDDQIIDSIRSRMVDGLITVPDESMRSGQVVRIARGPLEGIEAVFQRDVSGPQRVMLLLRAIAYQARLVVPRELVSNQ
jgi:transcriptional antiterminator RfaH